MKITNHAYEKAKERLSWKADVIEKMAEIALNEGISHSDTKGKLKRYITKLYLSHRTSNNIRIYGQNIYFFLGDTLITIYRVPTNLIKYLKHYN